MKERLKMFCRKHKPCPKYGTLKEDLLTHAQCCHLSRLHDGLDLFHVGILEIEGNGAFFYDGLPQLSRLLDELNNWRGDFANEASRDSTFAAPSNAVPHA